MTVVGSETLPVNSTADVLAEYPVDVRNVAVAPVRDGIIALQTGVLQEYQDCATYAKLQSSILTATDTYLEGLGSDRGIYRQPGEDLEVYRQRLLTVPVLVTPQAILSVVGKIIATYTVRLPQYMEASLDRWFLQDGTATWHSFIGADPSYPDRYFPDDSALNGGLVRVQSSPYNARVFSDTNGRYFQLYIPNLSGSDTEHAFILAGAGSFFGDGSNTSGAEADGSVATFVFPTRLLATQLYNLIVNAVESIKGQGIRWSAWVI
jgi:hypothetical protein